MNRLFSLLVAVFLSFSVLTISFGYAAMSRSLTVAGTAHAQIQSGVFISDVTVSELNNATEKVGGYAQCVLNTTVTLGESSDASVSYEVDFFNNSESDMAYVDTVLEQTAYDNGNLSFTVSGVLSGAVIPANGTLTLTLTVSKNAEKPASGALNAVVGFRFGEVIVFEEEPGKFEPGEAYKVLVSNILSNSNRYGLNDEHKGYVIHDALEIKGVLYSVDNVQGGNIDKMLNALQTDTKNINFVFEYISETEYQVYLYARDEAKVGQISTVYRQTFRFDGVEWYAGTALIGHATMKEVSRDKGTVVSLSPSDWIIGKYINPST